MTNAAIESAFDADAFLAWEDEQVEKHEYVRGEVFAMVGARREHVVVCGNLFAAFKQRLRGGPCQVYISDLKLRVESVNAFFYPDLSVSCDPHDHTASEFISHPVLIVEVLSGSTAAFDRGDKFAAYRTLPSLQDYVLVDIASRRVETFRRASDDDWLFHASLPKDGDCLFTALGISVPFDEIFENVETDGSAAADEELPSGG
jgi:Uma2 family endonuclease